MNVEDFHLGLYLLVTSVIEFHVVTTLKILGHKLYRIRQLLIGFSTDEYWKARCTGYQISHSTQDKKSNGFNRSINVVVKKAVAGSTNKLERHATTSD